MHEHDHSNCKMLTIGEAGRILLATVNTMRYWRQIGYGPRSFKVGRHFRYWECEVREWLANRTDEDRRSARAVH